MTEKQKQISNFEKFLQFKTRNNWRNEFFLKISRGNKFNFLLIIYYILDFLGRRLDEIQVVDEMVI